MKHITITGMDRTGKTSLAKEIMERVNYRWHVYDRDPTTIHAYNVLNDRLPKDPSEAEKYFIDYFKLIKRFDHLNDLVILLDAPEDIIKERFKHTNEIPLPSGQSIRSHLQAIKQGIRNAHYTRYVEFDTNEMSTKEIANKIFILLGVKA